MANNKVVLGFVGPDGVLAGAHILDEDGVPQGSPLSIEDALGAEKEADEVFYSDEGGETYGGGFHIASFIDALEGNIFLLPFEAALPEIKPSKGVWKKLPYTKT